MSGSSVHFGSGLLVVGCLAALLRGLHLWSVHQDPLFTVLMMDAKSYDAWARELAAGNWLGDEAFYQAPLYPYFLGALYTVFGPDALIARVVHAMLGSLSCVVLALAGRTFFSPRVGLVAGTLMAVYPPMIFFDGLLQKTTLAIFLLNLLLLVLAGIDRRPTSGRFLACGAAIGIFTLTRENGIIALPVTLAWLTLRFPSRAPRERFRWAVLLVTGVVLALGPVALRNQHVDGAFHVTTWNSGPMFFIGNHAHADGLHHPFEFGSGSVDREQQDAWQMAERETGHPLSSSEVSLFWWRRAWDDIRAEPLRWLDLLRRKALMLANAVEIADSEDQGALASRSPLLAWLAPLGFGVLLPLAVFGAVCTWDERRRLWLLYALALGYAATVVLFFVFSRYRSPLLPIMMLFSAVSLAGPLPQLLRAGRWRLLATAGGLAAIALYLAYRPIDPDSDPRPAMRALHHYNVGVELIHRDDLEGGEREIREALRIEPVANSMMAHYWLARAVLRQGRPQEARPLAGRAMRLAPGLAPVRVLVGETEAEQRDWPQAIRRYREALKLDPDFALAHLRLAEAYRAVGRREAAIAHYRRFLVLRPGVETARRELERLERRPQSPSPAEAAPPRGEGRR